MTSSRDTATSLTSREGGASGNSGQVSSSAILGPVPQIERPMRLEQNKQVVIDSFRVLETGEGVTAERIIAPDFINREADDDPDRRDRGLRGPAGVTATSRWLAETFSDLRFDHHEVVAEDERVVVVTTMTGNPYRDHSRHTPDGQTVSGAPVSFISVACRTNRGAFGAAGRSRLAASTRCAEPVKSSSSIGETKS
jgi:ketosteroid isomerase-like protein